MLGNVAMAEAHSQSSSTLQAAVPAIVTLLEAWHQVGCFLLLILKWPGNTNLPMLKIADERCRWIEVHHALSPQGLSHGYFTKPHMNLFHYCLHLQFQFMKQRRWQFQSFLGLTVLVMSARYFV